MSVLELLEELEEELEVKKRNARKRKYEDTVARAIELDETYGPPLSPASALCQSASCAH